MFRVRGLRPPGPVAAALASSLRAPSRPVPPRRAEPPPSARQAAHVRRSPVSWRFRTIAGALVQLTRARPSKHRQHSDSVNGQTSPKNGATRKVTGAATSAGRQHTTLRTRSDGPSHVRRAAAHNGTGEKWRAKPRLQRGQPTTLRAGMWRVERPRSRRPRARAAAGSARRRGTGREGARSELASAAATGPGGRSPLTRSTTTLTETSALLTGSRERSLSSSGSSNSWPTLRLSGLGMLLAEMIVQILTLYWLAICFSSSPG